MKKKKEGDLLSVSHVIAGTNALFLFPKLYVSLVNDNDVSGENLRLLIDDELRGK